MRIDGKAVLIFFFFFFRFAFFFIFEYGFATMMMMTYKDHFHLILYKNMAAGQLLPHFISYTQHISPFRLSLPFSYIENYASK